MARQRVCDLCGDTNRTVKFKLRRKWKLLFWYDWLSSNYDGSIHSRWRKKDFCDRCMNGILKRIEDDISS